MQEEKIKFRLVLPDGISDSDAVYYRNELQHSDIPGMGNVSFETVPDEDGSMGTRLENVLNFLGTRDIIKTIFDFILKIIHPVDIIITANIDDKGDISTSLKYKITTKRGLKKVNEELEKTIKILNENRPLRDVEFKLSSITGEDGKTVTTFDAQGLNSRAAEKANEVYKEHLDNRHQLDSVVQPQK